MHGLGDQAKVRELQKDLPKSKTIVYIKSVLHFFSVFECPT